MAGEARHEVGFAFEGGAARGHGPKSGVDIGHLEIEDRAKLFPWFFRAGEHEAEAATIEETHIGHLEQEGNAQGVTIECDGAIDVRDGDGDLADGREPEGAGCWMGGGLRRSPEVKRRQTTKDDGLSYLFLR